jgi:hypothetical protein
MKGKAPPVFFHADLLHPARRLWKRVLPSCSQGEIETAVLGLDRTGDTPGALAPDIWFAFLKTGETTALGGICDHNAKDIFGLTRLFSAMAGIAADPLGTHGVYSYDLEGLALHWRACSASRVCSASLARRLNRKWLAAYGGDRLYEGEIPETGNALLTAAARQGYPLAALALARDLFFTGDHEAGRGYLRRVAEGDHPPYMRARACRALAIDAERRLKNPSLALAYSEAALTPDEALPPYLRKDLIRRRDRLTKKSKGLPD